MAVNTDAIGKTYPPTTYAVGREKVIEYAHAVGETNPLHLDPAAAREAGYADVVAPPMFAVVFAGRAMTPALFDPEVGIDFAHMVHGGQEFRWGPLVVAGDEITTTTTGQGRVRARRDGVLRVRDRIGQPARRDRCDRDCGPTSCGAANDDRRRRRVRAHGHPGPVSDGPLRRRQRGLQPDPHRRGVRPPGRVCPAGSCTACGRWRRWPGRTPRPSAARSGSRACRSSSAAWGCSSRRSPCAARSRRSQGDDGGRRLRGHAERQADHPQRPRPRSACD